MHFIADASGRQFRRMAGFLLRFEVAGTNVSIAGTKDGGAAAILARSAKSG